MPAHSLCALCTPATQVTEPHITLNTSCVCPTSPCDETALLWAGATWQCMKPSTGRAATDAAADDGSRHGSCMPFSQQSKCVPELSNRKLRHTCVQCCVRYEVLQRLDYHGVGQLALLKCARVKECNNHNIRHVSCISPCPPPRAIGSQAWQVCDPSRLWGRRYHGQWPLHWNVVCAGAPV